MPAFYLLDPLSRFLPVPQDDGLFLLLLGLPINLLLYFLLGYLIDYIVNPFRIHSHADDDGLWTLKNF